MEWVMLVFLGAGLVIGVAAQYLLSKARFETARLAQQAETQQQLAELREQKAGWEARQQHLVQQGDADKSALKERDDSIVQLQQELATRSEQNASLHMALEKEREQAEEKLQVLKDAKEQLTREFESLANRIFEEKSERFSKNSKTTLDGAINPLREQLSDFKKKVEDVYDKESKERVSLLSELGHLKELNQQMSKDALNLTKALKGDNKAQGNWGEVILERVLEESGLHKGREYETQVSLKDDEGRRRSPDVIVHLPDNKDIIIDAKVSLIAYERYCNSEDDTEKQQALKEHIASVREHIQSLSFKDYENLKAVRTLDFVFIFIPIEAAFMAAFEHDQAMFRDAYEKNIIVVSPTTLLASLRTVQSIWRYERQNKNAEEIARQAGALHDKFVGFIADIEDIGKHLERAGNAQQQAFNKLSSGRGNLVTSTQKLEKLGAKVKKPLPESVLNRVDEESLALESVNEQDEIL
jgi:DNA recombination protein RmuC